jgi:hypothetical protein
MAIITEDRFVTAEQLRECEELRRCKERTQNCEYSASNCFFAILFNLVKNV